MPPSASCMAQLSAWCVQSCPIDGVLTAALGGSRKGPSQAWRCYQAPGLDERGVYVDHEWNYCTRHTQLQALLLDCEERGLIVQDVVSPRGETSPHVDRELAEGWWPLHKNEEVLVPAVDTRSWQPTRDHELLQVRAWQLPCIDSPEQHFLLNRTGNVSRKKAFLSRRELSCYGQCVRGVVDGFATHAEVDEMLTLRPGDRIKSWRWNPPMQPAVFAQLIARAEAVLRERFHVSALRFYRANMIQWDGLQVARSEWPAQKREWHPQSLHGDTNVCEPTRNDRTAPDTACHPRVSLTRPTSTCQARASVHRERVTDGRDVHVHDDPVPVTAWRGRLGWRDRHR